MEIKNVDYWKIEIELTPVDAIALKHACAVARGMPQQDADTLVKRDEFFSVLESALYGAAMTSILLGCLESGNKEEYEKLLQEVGLKD